MNNLSPISSSGVPFQRESLTPLSLRDWLSQIIAHTKDNYISISVEGMNALNSLNKYDFANEKNLPESVRNVIQIMQGFSNQTDIQNLYKKAFQARQELKSPRTCSDYLCRSLFS